MNAIQKKTKTSKKISGKVKAKRRRLPNNRTKRANIIRGRKIAAASAKNFKKQFTMLRQNGNSVRVTGRDLIYSIPDELTAPIQSTNVITVIPANPAYWKGTRIAALASGYQNYRPIMFKITYVPICAVTQQGNVIGGTIWDDGIDNDNLQQSLRTSNGGFMTQCYVPHTTRIRPKSNLQFNLYRMGGEFSTTSNPFIFVALAIGCKNNSSQRVVPGYFYVTWSFELKNPIGSINTYNNTGLITYAALNLDMNNTIININPAAQVPFGAYIDIETNDNDEKVAYYNGTPVEIANDTPVWAFTSVTRPSQVRLVGRNVIYYTGISTDPIHIGYQGYKAYMVDKETHYEVFVPRQQPTDTVPDRYYTVQNSEPILTIQLLQQIFGTYTGNQNITMQEYTSGSLSGNVTVQFAKYQADKDKFSAILRNQELKQQNTPLIMLASRIQQLHIQPEPEKDTKQDEEQYTIQQTDSFTPNTNTNN